MTTGKQTTGQMAEETAYRYLEEQGLSLIERNYLCPRGEIDLIMKDRTTTVFVEVRYRNNVKFGSGAESVDWKKQKKLVAAANHYLLKNPKAAKGACRFDVVSLTANNRGEQNLDWIPDAFQASP